MAKYNICSDMMRPLFIDTRDENLNPRRQPKESERASFLVEKQVIPHPTIIFPHCESENDAVR